MTEKNINTDDISLSGKRLLSSQETMRYLNIGKDKLIELMKKGDLSPVEIDRSNRFDIQDLNKFIEDRKK